MLLCLRVALDSYDLCITNKLVVLSIYNNARQGHHERAMHIKECAIVYSCEAYGTTMVAYLYSTAMPAGQLLFVRT